MERRALVLPFWSNMSFPNRKRQGLTANNCMAYSDKETVGLIKTTKTFQQLIRYGIVGTASNFTGYLIYLFITWFGVDPKITVTILYPLGIVIAYFGHSKYSFAFRGRPLLGGLRYVIAQFGGYLLNVLVLFLFVDKLLFPHQIVQLAAIFLVAGFLFLMFKFFVFPNTAITEK